MLTLLTNSEHIYCQQHADRTSVVHDIDKRRPLQRHLSKAQRAKQQLAVTSAAAVSYDEAACMWRSALKAAWSCVRRHISRETVGSYTAPVRATVVETRRSHPVDRRRANSSTVPSAQRGVVPRTDRVRIETYRNEPRNYVLRLARRWRVAIRRRQKTYQRHRISSCRARCERTFDTGTSQTIIAFTSTIC